MEKVWHICSNRWNSAITEYALSAARATVELGLTTVFSPLAGSKGEARALAYGLETAPFRSFGLGGLRTFASLLRKIKPSRVILYGGPETTFSRLLIKEDPSIKVFRFRGDLFRSTSRFSALKYRISTSNVYAEIAPSRYIEKHLQAVNGKRICVVPLGCDSDVFYPSAKEFWDAGLKQRPEVIILGRFDPIKGHRRLFRLIRLVIDGWSSSEVAPPLLHVVGQPANLDKSDLEFFARKEGLIVGKDVKFTTERVSLDVLPAMLSEATLGIVSSLGSEVICRVAEELLLCGTPLVVSGAGSLDEVLFDGAGESYVNLEDKEAAQTISRVTIQSALEGFDAKLARSRKAKELFSIKAMAENLKRAIQ